MALTGDPVSARDERAQRKVVHIERDREQDDRDDDDADDDRVRAPQPRVRDDEGDRDEPEQRHLREEGHGADDPDGASAAEGRGIDGPDALHPLYATGPMRSTREPWSCARCSTLNLSTARSCRRCGNARGVRLARDRDGAPGLAAILTGLVPGLGQMYQERWIRGAIVFLIPVLAVALGGAFVATFDPLTSLVVKNATLFALAIVGGLLLYHLFAVSD